MFTENFTASSNPIGVIFNRQKQILLGDTKMTVGSCATSRYLFFEIDIYEPARNTWDSSHHSQREESTEI